MDRRIKQLFNALGRSLYQVRRVMETGVEKVRVGWFGWVGWVGLVSCCLLSLCLPCVSSARRLRWCRQTAILLFGNGRRRETLS